MKDSLAGLKKTDGKVESLEDLTERLELFKDLIHEKL